MKKTSFETRQRAEDLIQATLEIWRQSDQSDYLEGLEDDPVFQLLMMAMAYQANEIDSDIERLKADVIDEYTQAILPFLAGHAVPSTIAVSAGLAENVGEQELNSDSVFTLSGTDHNFIPLLKTKVFNMQLNDLKRVDGRRWNVTLEFGSNLRDLSGMAIAIKDTNFAGLNLSIGGKSLPLIKPWDIANIPYSDAFSLDTMLYNRSQAYDTSVVVMDLFNSQDINLFFIGEHNPDDYDYSDKTSVDVEFEFEGIDSDYIFERRQLVFNPVILANADIHTVHLSSDSPICRIGGEDCQFLQMVRPSVDQIYHNCIVDVRKIAADRFNRSSLVKLLSSLSAKFSSDFYAFQDIHTENGDKVTKALNSLIERMYRSASEGDIRSTGTYLLLRQGLVGHKSHISLDISYLTTDGAAVNSSISKDCKFNTPAGINPETTVVISNPSAGRDEIEIIDYPEMTKYYLATNNRIVTPADMRLYCTTELTVRYGINQAMIQSVKVNRAQSDTRNCGYSVNVSIILKDNSFVRRSLGNNPDAIAAKMAKKMFSRSPGVYPIKVRIQLTNDK